MSAEEKPLHVQVAEALGCKPEHITFRRPSWWRCNCNPYRPHNYNDDSWQDVHLKHYDTDWSATGPLIEKYRISLGAIMIPGAPWVASVNAGSHEIRASVPQSQSPLVAVCSLILALAEAGKL